MKKDNILKRIDLIVNFNTSSNGKNEHTTRLRQSVNHYEYWEEDFGLVDIYFDSFSAKLTSTKENFDGKNFFDLRRVFHINHTNLLILNLV